MVSGFELADADGVYYPAAAEAQGNVIRLRAGHVEKPAHVRYAWRNAPVPTVFNREGFPAAPFQRVIE
jgi:sialate O-acetylesterase